jgi:hypothetical protein
MGGNDNLKPSGVNDWVKRAELQCDFFLNPDKSGCGSLFYDISQSGMHHQHFGKKQGVTEQHIPVLAGA